MEVPVTFHAQDMVEESEPTSCCNFCEPCFEGDSTKQTVSFPHTRGFCRKPREDLREPETIRNGRKPHKCDICQKAFSRPCRLENHKRRAHTVKEPFQCDRCHRSFKDSRCFSDHIYKSSEKPSICDVCNKAFCTSLLLRAHRKMHTVEEVFQSKQSPQSSVCLLLFKCDHCGEFFSGFPLLKDHEKIHCINKSSSLEISAGNRQQLQENCKCCSFAMVGDSRCSCGQFVQTRSEYCVIKQEPEEAVFEDLTDPLKLEEAVADQQGVNSNISGFQFVTVGGHNDFVQSTDSSIVKMKEELIEGD